MKWDDRRRWLLQRISEEPGGYVDVVNKDFVLDYCIATNALAAEMPYGAPKCPRLGQDLKKLKDQGCLQRHRTGLQGMGGMGFPRWVWSYRLSTYGRALTGI